MGINGEDISRNEVILNYYSRIKKNKNHIKLNLVLAVIIPILLFVVFIVLVSNFSFNAEIFEIRRRLIELLIIYDLVIILVLLHIRIIKPKVNEKNSKKYIRAGWLVMKTSHHKKNRMDHEVKIGDYYFCAGCYGGIIGLFVGGNIGLIYVFNFQSFTSIVGLILLIFGLILVLFSFFKYIIKIYGFKRLFINSSLPAGIWLLFIGSDIIFKNIIGIIFIISNLLFLGFERLYIANLDHKLVDLIAEKKKVVKIN